MGNTTTYDVSLPEIRRILERLLPHGHPTVGQVAAETGVRMRTLQRRLAQVGLSHSILVRQVQLSRACLLLTSREVTISQISIETGFATPGSFSRAFRAWTGVSPRELRRNPDLARNVKF